MGEVAEFIVEDGVLVRYCGVGGVVFVPSSVKVIGTDAFRIRQEVVTEVVLPDGVLELADSAFENCEVLERVNLPSSIVRIGHSVFCGCSSLCEMDIPENVTEIEECAFAGCHSLVRISIPEDVKKIGVRAFCDCHSLASIVLPQGISVIEERTFHNCRKLVSIDIPDSVVKIDYAAFRGCSSLKEVSFGKNLSVFGAEGMGGIFEGCKSLKSISLPDAVKYLPYAMFRDCHSLSCVDLPKSLEKLCDDVFWGCASLKRICIPKNMTRFENLPWMLGNDVFSGCFALREIELEGEDGLYVSVDGALYSKDMKSLERIPIGYEGVFCVPEGVERIGRYAFCGCVSLARVDIASSVLDVDLSCFNDCKNLVWIAMDEDNLVYSSVKGVLFDKDETVLLRCPPGKRNRYDVFEGVEVIWERAFLGCAELDCVSLPDSVEEIGESAFDDCRRLSRLVFDERHVRIGEHAFDDCHRLPDTVAPDVIRYR